MPQPSNGLRVAPRRLTGWDRTALAVLAVASCWVTVSLDVRTFDDAYVTYRCARNLARGAGFDLNIGSQMMSCTSPLYTALVAGGAILTSEEQIPNVGQWLSGGSLFAIAAFVYLLFRGVGQWVGGLSAAVLIVLNPATIELWGSDTLLLLALALPALYYYLREDVLLAGALLGLAVLTRGEGVVMAAMLLAHSILVRRTFPLGPALAFTIMVLPWAVYGLHAYGSPLPGTLAAKVAQGRSGHFAPFLTTSLKWIASFAIPVTRFSTTWTPCHVPAFALAGLGALFVVEQPRWSEASERVWLFAGWIACYVVGYTALGVPFYHWYAAPLVVAGAGCAGLAAQRVHDWASVARLRGNAARGLWANALVVAVVATSATGSVLAVRAARNAPPSRVERLYTKAGGWLRENTPSGASFGFFEIGFMGYHAERYVIDPMGLAQPDVAAHVERADFKWAYRKYRPDYLVLGPVRWYDRIGNIQEETWFEGAYVSVAEVAEEGYVDSPLTIFQKIDDERIPPPAGPLYE